MEFTPILRFAVMSDNHYQVKKPFLRKRFENAMKFVYDYCDTQDYNKLDALYVVGDFTDLGKREEMEMFKEDIDSYVKKETMPVVTLANHELHYGIPSETAEETALANFEDIFKMSPDRHEVINGFHFISVTTTRGKGGWHDSFSDAKKEYLKTELDRARDDGGNKPIFVFQHPGNAWTIGGGFFGANEIQHILCEYPQIIDFSGHSHQSVNDAFEIHQKNYTSLGTGSMYNISTFSSVTHSHILSGIHNRDEYAQFLLVEVDAKGSVLVKRVDAIELGFFENDSLIEECWNISKYKYTLQRAVDAPKPYFTDDKLEVNGNTVSFARAKCDGERVMAYLVRTLDKNGVILSGENYTSDYLTLVQKDVVTLPVKLNERVAAVQVYAYGFWDNYSDPITANI